MKKNFVKVFVVVLLSLASTRYVCAENLSFLSGSLTTTGNEEMHARLIVKDSAGNRLCGGINVAATGMLTEIPGSRCSIEALEDSETGNPGPESVMFDISPAAAGTYVFEVYGNGVGQYNLHIGGYDTLGGGISNSKDLVGYLINGSTSIYSVEFSPEPGHGIENASKNVTFADMRQDIETAKVLSYIGDAKFVDSLLKNIDLAEKLAGVCDKRKTAKTKSCVPATALLRLFVKRLELANRKCDTAGGCDEGPELASFDKAHRGDRDYDDFFRAWDKDDWQKWKKTSKRFVTDEALAIIRGDAEILIKTLEPSPQKPEKH